MSEWYGGRALLNQPGQQSTAAIVAEIQNTENDTPRACGSGESAWVDHPMYMFQLSDCTRSVSFDLDFSTLEARENNLFKVRTMIEILERFEQGLYAETKRYATRLNEQRAKSGTVEE